MTVLCLGSRDRFGETAVADWQTMLERLGYPPGPTDGVFGTKTEKATLELQHASGVNVDGIVGPATMVAAERLDHRDTKPDDLLHGLDVSSFQGEIDWGRVAAAGKRFAWIRLLTELGGIDKRFAENWRGAAGAGLLVGAYAFLSAESSAEVQARAFLRALPAGAPLPPVVDIERGSHGGTPRAAAVLAFARLVEEGLRARGSERYVVPMVYTGPAYAASFLRGSPALADHALWVAHYGVAAPTVPPPWSDWSAWQTGTGTCDGIAGPVDLDVLKAAALSA